MGELVARPLLLLLGPAAVVVLFLLERWRRRPLTVVVADLTLFEVTPEVEQAAAAQRQQLSARFLLRAAAALLLAAATAGLTRPAGPGGPVTVDVILDRGLSSGARLAEGSRLDRHRAHLSEALARLRPQDRVRLHLLPATGPAPLLSPHTTSQVLEHVSPLAGHADVQGLANRLAPQALAEGRPRVLVATDRPVTGHALALALAAEPVVDRALLSLRREEDALHAACASYQAAGPTTVRFTVGSGSEEVSGEVDLQLPASGVTLVSWPLPPDAPATLTWARAELLGDDGLQTDDHVFAAVPPLARRVGILGEPGPWVRRALRAVPGTRLVELDRSGLEEAGSLDLLVVPSLALVEDSPGVALCVVPPSLSSRARPGGRVSGRQHPAFRHTLTAVDAEPFTLPQLGPLPPLQRSQALLLAGEEPWVTLTGQGDRLVAAVASPLDRATSPWPELESFPLFWAELLDLAAPRSKDLELSSHTVGRSWAGGPAPLDVTLVRREDGVPLLGTAATAPQGLEQSTIQPFSSQDLAAIDQARPRGAPRPLTTPLVVLALVLILISWKPSSS